VKPSLKFFASVPCLAAFLAIAGYAHADIVTNGALAGSGNTIAGWTVAGTGITPGDGITSITLGGPGASTPFGDIIPDAPGGTTTAAYFVDDNANETLSQSISLAANTAYSLTFDLFGVQSGAGNQFNFELVDSVGALASSCFANAPLAGCSSVANGVWTVETLNFTTGAATNYNLEFAFTSGATPAKDVALTNVAIAATPEPSSFVLLGSGLLAAAGAIRRRMSV
jgi:hypothetical protein